MITKETMAMVEDFDTVSTSSGDGGSTMSSSAAARGGGAGGKKRNHPPPHPDDDGDVAPPPAPPRAGGGDDAGSSRLFQPHRSLGLLAASPPAERSSSPSPPSPFRSRRGEFHLQSQCRSSEDAFATVPLGERFQIVSLGKLVPALVSRALPPSAGNARDEEEVHRAFSDASMDVTVATHGPRGRGGGRAVSATLYARTRPIVRLDAFPFLRRGGRSGNDGSGKKDGAWGIVDVIPLGKQRVAMSGEKEGRMENALLFAMVCARGDDGWRNGGASVEKGGGEEVQVVGDESEDESDDNISSSSSSESEAVATGASNSSDESGEDSDDSATSLEDENKPPAKDCFGRVLLVQATRTTLEIIKAIDLDGGIGSNFVPYVGLHPATYVNKILLGGRPAAVDWDGDEEEKSTTTMLLLNVRTGKIIHSFRCLSNTKTKKTGREKNGGHSITITALEQSPAVDTVAVGTSCGYVHLVNTLHDIKLFTLHHKGKGHPNKKSNDLAVSSISFRTDGNAIRQGVAPLAVGCSDGSISVWDLTPVEDDDGSGATRRPLLTKMEGVHRGGVSALSYLPGEPLLLSTGVFSNSMILHVFDSPDHSGRVLRSRRGHTSPPRLLRYLHPGVSGGGGSSSVLAGASDGTDAASCQILSCGGPGDLSLRLFSTARSNLDREYSQGPGLDKKARRLFGEGNHRRDELLLPEIVGLATSDARGRDWGDLVTIHRDHAMAYVWSTTRGAQTGPVLRQPHWNVSAMKERPPRSAHATSLAVSSCGNFALVGTSGGVVYKYNLQSGLPRGSFPRGAAEALTPKEERRRRKGLQFAGDVGRTMRVLERKVGKGGTAPADVDKAERDHLRSLSTEAKRKAIVGRASHDGAVVGIAVDSLNRTVVTAGADSKLVLWNFSTHMPHRRSPVQLPSPATRLAHVRDSDLAAIAMKDYGVAVFDCSGLTIVRYFGGSRCREQSSGKDSCVGHTGPISDLVFGQDGRKLFTSSLDGTIRVWDVPAGLCVDWSEPGFVACFGVSHNTRHSSFPFIYVCPHCQCHFHRLQRLWR